MDRYLEPHYLFCFHVRARLFFSSISRARIFLFKLDDTPKIQIVHGLLSRHTNWLLSFNSVYLYYVSNVAGPPNLPEWIQSQVSGEREALTLWQNHGHIQHVRWMWRHCNVWHTLPQCCHWLESGGRRNYEGANAQWILDSHHCHFTIFRNWLNFIFLYTPSV